ncbi:MAG: ABC transporter permease [Lachnospiraceae bacterium]|jgi:ABC-2 type transport system permease protein
MKHNLGVVFRFEFAQQVRKKSFVITTVIFLAAICFLAAAPAIFRSAIEPDESYSEESVYTFSGGVYYEDASWQGLLPFEEGHVYPSEKQLRQAVGDETESIGYVIVDSTHIKTIYKNYGIYSSSESSAIVAAMQAINTQQQLARLGITAEQYAQIESQTVQNETVILGENTASQYISGFIFILLVYMVVLIYGQFASVSVAREKDSKTMELLITMTNPDALILGKVFAVIAVVLMCLALYLGAAAVSFTLAKPYYPAAVLQFLSENVSTSMLGIYLLYFILALVLYMFLFAALGSTVSKIEDVSAAITPVTLFMIFAYTLAFPAMSGYDGLPVKIASWIPFFSVLLMPIRYANAAISAPIILLSTATTIAFTVLLAYISIRIYRWGTLNYGNRKNIFTVLKEVFSKT